MYTTQQSNWDGYARVFDADVQSVQYAAVRAHHVNKHIGIWASDAGSSKADEVGIEYGTDTGGYSVWNHYCWMYDGTDTKSFVDGVVITTKSNYNAWYVACGNQAWPAGQPFQLFHYKGATVTPPTATSSPIAYFTNLRMTANAAVYNMSGFASAPIVTAPEPFSIDFGGY